MGYGVKLTPDVKGYLDRIADGINDPIIWGKKKTLAVITTGGFTDPVEKISEAGMMAAYLKKRCPSLQIIAEEKATTTNENLRNTGKLMLEYNFVNTNDTLVGVIVCCDKLRELKVNFLAKRLLPITKISFVLVDGIEMFSHTFFERRILQPFKTVVDMLGYYLPMIEQMEVRRRKARRDKKAKKQKIIQKI